MPNVLILGASSDLSQSIAEIYAKNGNNLWLAGRDLDFLSSQKRDLEIRFSISAMIFYWDAGDFKSISFFLDNLPNIPDITFYVAGYLGSDQPLTEKYEEIKKIMDSNFLGAVSIFNELALRLKLQKSGTLIGISSVAGDRGRQSNFLYGSAKAGFTAYLSGLRNALFPFGVHVMTVKPGFMFTSMTEGLNLPKVLTLEPSKAAAIIYDAEKEKKNIIYVSFLWFYIMLIIKHIPEFIFKRLKL